jgi:SAM-dependent MidA family methyltransferase
MEWALYEPNLGYYTSPGRKVGAEGDFYTSSNVHELFGRVIARQLIQMWESLDKPGNFSIVEQGAGGGQLAADILGAIQDLAPPLYQKVTYHLIEREPSLRQAQEEKLQEHITRLAWHDPQELLTGSFTFTGCLVTNELVDSFPVHVIQGTQDGLREIYVGLENDHFVEVLADPSQEIIDYLQQINVSLLPGQRAEVNLAAVQWLKSVAKALIRGYILTIDYGYIAQELYNPMRRNGTLLCYWHHTTEENPYIRVGEQDITSHVDFTTLMMRGEHMGLKTIWFGEQYRFLLATGLMEEMMAIEARTTKEEELLKIRLTIKKLILPDGGMGDTFKVLIQGKDVGTPSLLCMRDWGTML